MVLLIVDLLAILFYSFRGGKYTTNISKEFTGWGEELMRSGKFGEWLGNKKVPNPSRVRNLLINYRTISLFIYDPHGENLFIDPNQ